MTVASKSEDQTAGESIFAEGDNHFRRVLLLVTIAVSLLILILPPGLYFFTALDFERHELASHSESLSTRIYRISLINPKLWMYQNERFEEILEDFSNEFENEINAKILTNKNEIVAEVGEKLSWPKISFEGKIVGFDSQIGQTVIDMDVTQILVKTLMAMLMGGGIALAMLVAMRVLPIRALNRTINERDEAYDLMAQMNSQLEERVQERTGELEVALETAVDASEAKSKFLASMSHELRTPLNAVLGFGQLLETIDDPPLSDEQLDCVKYILGSGNQLFELINEILELSKIESGQTKLQLEEIGPAEVIHECVDMLQMRATESDIRISVSSELDNFQPLKTDVSRFRQVALNIISNAVKYNRPGGEINISAEHNSTGELRILIADTGYGIPVDKQDKVFEPFDRLGRESGTIEGSGIGLTISKRLVELLGGDIDFKSEENAGSVFWIDLPLK